MEIWKPIKGFETYEISSYGKKYHFDSIDQCARELGLFRSNANRVLHGYLNTTGGYQIKKDCEAYHND